MQEQLLHMNGTYVRTCIYLVHTFCTTLKAARTDVSNPDHILRTLIWFFAELNYTHSYRVPKRAKKTYVETIANKKGSGKNNVLMTIRIKKIRRFFLCSFNLFSKLFDPLSRGQMYVYTCELVIVTMIMLQLDWAVFVCFLRDRLPKKNPQVSK